MSTVKKYYDCNYIYEKKFTPLLIDNYADFKKKCDNQWYDFFKTDYEIPQEREVYDFYDLKADMLHDRFAVKYNKTVFECLLTLTEPSSEYMVVYLSNATRKKVNGEWNLKYPTFNRWSYFPFCNCNVLTIADPMLQEYDELELGWFYGNKEESYLEYISKIVKNIKKLLSIRKIIFFSSSAGGYATLAIAQFFSGSIHLAINPQICLQDFPYAKEFERITGIDLLAKDKFHRNEVIKIVKEKIDCKFVIFQNGSVEHDCDKHLFPLCRALDINKLNIGLNFYDYFAVWMYNAVGGHNAQGSQLHYTYMVHLIKQMMNDDYIPSDFEKTVYKSISCMYRQSAWWSHLSLDRQNQISKLESLVKDKERKIDELEKNNDNLRKKISDLPNYYENKKFDSFYIIIGNDNNSILCHNIPILANPKLDKISWFYFKENEIKYFSNLNIVKFNPCIKWKETKILYQEIKTEFTRQLSEMRGNGYSGIYCRSNELNRLINRNGIIEKIFIATKNKKIYLILSMNREQMSKWHNNLKDIIDKYTKIYHVIPTIVVKISEGIPCDVLQNIDYIISDGSVYNIIAADYAENFGGISINVNNLEEYYKY